MSYSSFIYLLRGKSFAIKKLIESFVVDLVRLKLLKYVTLAPSIGPVVGAIVRTMFDFQVIIFAGVLLMVVLAFTIGFYVAFGQLLDAYQSFQLSVVQTVLMMIGTFDLDSLSEASPGFGPAMFFSVILVLALVMLNIFIAVISEVYSSALSESNDRWNENLTKRMIESENRNLHPIEDIKGLIQNKRGLTMGLRRLWKLLVSDPPRQPINWTERTVSMFTEYRLRKLVEAGLAKA
jgi:hypothetical protein